MKKKKTEKITKKKAAPVTFTTNPMLTDSLLTSSVLSGTANIGTTLTGSALAGFALTGIGLSGATLAGNVLTGSTLTGSINVNYGSAINYLTVQTGKLNAVTNQINFLTSPVYQPSILTAVKEVQSHLATFNNIQSYLPTVDHLTMVSPIIDYSRQATISLTNLSSPSIISGLATSVGTNLGSWYNENIAKSSLLSASAYSTLNIGTTSTNLATTIGSQTLSALTIQSSIVKATEFSLFAEKSLFGVTPDNFGSKLTLTDITKNYLTASVLGLSESYSTLLKSYESNPISYVQLSPTLSRIVPIEYFSTANLLEAISVEEEITAEEELLKNEIQYENEISLSEYLPKIDPALYKMWKGAIEAYYSDNSDKVRHFTTSIRELYTHLLHKLAPDSEIKKWTSDPANFYEGRPKRKTRLLFICRNISNDPFNAFVRKDVDATIAFIDIFQKGTHDIDPVFSAHHMLTIKSKAENTLKFLLEIHFTTNN